MVIPLKIGKRSVDLFRMAPLHHPSAELRPIYFPIGHIVSSALGMKSEHTEPYFRADGPKVSAYAFLTVTHGVL
jgi:hypothetical protein